MKITNIALLSFMFALSACSSKAEDGEACAADEDCADGLHCHIDGDAEEGVCEAEGEHDDEHSDEDHSDE